MIEPAKFFELTSDVMCIADMNGRCRAVNAAFSQVLGYRLEAMSAAGDRTLWSIGDAERAADVESALARLRAGESPVRFTNRCQCQNGEWRWFEWTLAAVDSDSDAPASVSLAEESPANEAEGSPSTGLLLYCVGHDISDRMDNLARYKLLADHSTDIISRQTIAGEYLYVSPAAYSVLGYDPEEMIGRNRYEFVHPEDAVTIQRKMAAVAQRLANSAGQSGSFSDSAPVVFRARHQQGHYVWMEASHRILSGVTLFDPYKVVRHDPADVAGMPSDALTSARSPSDEVSKSPNSRDDAVPDISSVDVLGDVSGTVSGAVFAGTASVDFDGDASPEIIVIARNITRRRASEQKILAFNEMLKGRVSERTQQLAVAEDRYAEIVALEKDAKARAKEAKTQVQLYSQAVENMEVGLYIWRLEDENDDYSLRMIATNPAAIRATGVSADAVLDELILDAFPALAATNIPQIYANVVRTQTACDLGEVLYGDSRIQQSTFAVKAFPLALNCIGISFENITERKQSEAIRQDQAAQLSTLFDQAAVGIARLSPEGQWIQVNQRLCDMLDYSMPALLKKNFREVSHPDDADADSEAYEQLASGGRSQVSFEKRYCKRTGEVVWAYVTASAVRDADGELQYFVVTIQDITQRKIATLDLVKQKNNLLAVNIMLTDTMSALKQRNQELDQFAYVTSHDLKAPLRAIANLATWIEEDIGSDLPPENAEQFELLKSRVHRMERLINGLLEYSRIGRSHQSHERVDVSELLAEVIDFLGPLNKFSIEVAPGMPVLEAKRAPLMQIFSNLIGNAIKYHDRADGHVQVSVRDEGAFYEFAVADDGPGIAPNYHEKVFTIFQTLQARDEVESTGIGLSIVKKAVTAEGGEVSLASALGEGATFRFTWPKSPHKGIVFPA
ncbi:MAG: PAS domain S-box protein [Cyanobacteria bacterium P01_A01_bin.116]